MEEAIRADLESSFGLHGDLVNPVSGGWMNRKWKLVCGGKEWLVKQFSRKRFSQKQLNWIEESMQRQIIAQREGVPCPRVLSFQGKVLRTLADGTTYMVMEFCPGVMLDHNTVMTDQMYSLGRACGQIHRTFSALPPQGVRGYPLDRKSVLHELREHYRTQMAECGKAAEEGGPAGSSSDFSDSLRNFFVLWSRSGEFWRSFPLIFSIAWRRGSDTRISRRTICSFPEMRCLPSWTLTAVSTAIGFMMWDGDSVLCPEGWENGSEKGVCLSGRVWGMDGFWRMRPGRMFRGLAGAHAFRCAYAHLVY